MAGLLGKMEQFDRETEEWPQYVDRLGHFWEAYWLPNGRMIRLLQSWQIYWANTIDEMLESVAAYVADLRRLAEFCDFGGTLNKMIRDRLVCGINHEGIQKKLLAERSYDRALIIGLRRQTRTCMKEMRMQKPPMTVKQEPVHQLQQRTKDFQGKACYRCGGMNHKAEDCRFREQVCRNCQKKGHIARVCRSKSKAPTQNDTHRGL